MKQEGDELIKQKTDALDTLAGGVVFGKEAAWERLQERMDKKPAKPLVTRYRVAASILLCIALGLAVYVHKQQKEAITIKQNKASKWDHTISRPSLSITNITEGNKPRQIMNDVRQEKTGRPSVNTNEDKQVNEKPAISRTENVIMPPEMTAEHPHTNHTKPFVKVIHINDINNAPAIQGTNTVPPGPIPTVAVTARTRVIHINDLGAGETQKMQEENQMQYQENIAVKSFPYIPAGNEHYAFHPSLKIKFSSQN